MSRVRKSTQAEKTASVFDLRPSAAGRIPSTVASSIGLADAEHFVLLGVDGSGERWALFTGDLEMGHMIEHAVRFGQSGDSVPLQRDALPWIRRGWPASVAAEFALEGEE